MIEVTGVVIVDGWLVIVAWDCFKDVEGGVQGGIVDEVPRVDPPSERMRPPILKSQRTRRHATVRARSPSMVDTGVSKGRRDVAAAALVW